MKPWWQSWRFVAIVFALSALEQWFLVLTRFRTPYLVLGALAVTVAAVVACFRWRAESREQNTQ